MIGLLVIGLICAGPPSFETAAIDGRVVTLAAGLKGLELPADEATTAGQVVVKGDDGSLTPILADDASRALFVDPRLRDRKARLQVRRYRGVPHVQVLSFQVEDQGTMRSPEYDCDVCAISVRFPQECPCCQGPMVLRMKPKSP